jgi:hypothetical protein
MYIAHTLRTDKDSKAIVKGTKRFTDHKSARSFSRRSIRRGASFVAVFEREKAGDDSNEVLEDDALKNVYRASVDDEGVRNFVRIPVEDFQAFAKGVTKSSKGTSKKA